MKTGLNSHPSGTPWALPNLRQPVFQYGLALLAVAAATLLRWAVNDLFGSTSPYITFYAAIMVVAGLAGRGPALFATILGGTIGYGIFFGAAVTHPPWTSTAEHIRLTMYLAIGAFISLMAGRLRKSERQILESESRYRQLFDSMSEGLLYLETVYDEKGKVVDLRVLDVNPAYARQMRVIRDQVLGKSAVESLSHIDAFWLERYNKLLKPGQPLSLKEYLPDLKKWFLIDSFTPQPDRLALIFRDITERMRVEEELRMAKQAAEKTAQKQAELRSTLESIIDTVPIGLIVANGNGAFTNSTRATNEIFGGSVSGTAADPEPKTYEVLLPNGSPFPGNELPLVQSLRKAQCVLDREMVIRRRDGSEVTVLARSAPVLDDQGRVISAVATLLDITKRKRIEEDLRRSHDDLEMRVTERTAKLQDSEARLRSLASQLIDAQETERKRIAHELHDSLAAQLAAVKYRVEYRFKHTGSDENSTAMEETIQDIQDAITETRRIMANLRPSVLDDLGIVPALSWFCSETEKSYPGTSVQFTQSIQEEEIPEELKIVLFRIVQESVTNAIRHGKSSRIWIDLERNVVWLRLIVKDEGKGFNAVKPREPFGSGGIGLNSMQQRVESTAGMFSVTSTPGKGTTVKAEWKIR